MPDKGTAAGSPFHILYCICMVPRFATMPNNRTHKPMLSHCTLPQGLSSPDEDCLLLRPQQDANQTPLKQSPFNSLKHQESRQSRCDKAANVPACNSGLARWWSEGDSSTA